MLAEKHTRVKYSINPRGNVWSNDEDKFGQKMLEKFGWEKGKGLGLKEDGCKEHVKVSKKSDTKGLGFKKVFGDNLISHQDDFNSLLNSLSETHINTRPNDCDGVSKMAEKSCSAKKRVHYHKHMLGKDLSGRTAEDMDCIFGRRKSKQKKSETKPLSVSSPSLLSEVTSTASANFNASAEKPVIDEDYGVATINSGKSVAEYFAMKMKMMMKGTSSQVTNTEADHSESLIAQSSELKFCPEEGDACSKKTTKDKLDSVMDVDTCLEETVKKKSKKKRKKKKWANDEETMEERTEELMTDVNCGNDVADHNKDVCETTDESVTVEHKKKKNKKKCKDASPAGVVECSDEVKLKKSKKKKKVKYCEVLDSRNIPSNCVEPSTSSLQINGEQHNLCSENHIETIDEDFNAKKKKKKKKRSREEMDDSNQDSLSFEVDKNSIEACTAPKSRKSEEQPVEEVDVSKDTINKKECSLNPEAALYTHYTLENYFSVTGNQEEIKICRKDIKHNTEALQSALDKFQHLGANVLDIIGYSA
ncbi:hypothetical protein Ahia01_000118400 [Argonauta hians]